MVQQPQMLDICPSIHHQLLILSFAAGKPVMTIHQQHQELLRPQLQYRLLRLRLRPLQCQVGT